MRNFFSLCFLMSLATQVAATPQSYKLNLSESQIYFSYVLQGIEFTGTIPIASAEISLDFGELSNSSISVAFDVSEVHAGIAPLTEAIKSKSVLATGSFPIATFASETIKKAGNTAQLNGFLTLRGTTNPVTLHAELFRQRGSEIGDLNELVVLITGTFNRHVFGASGYSSIVDQTIGLRVIATLDRN